MNVVITAEMDFGSRLVENLFQKSQCYNFDINKKPIDKNKKY